MKKPNVDRAAKTSERVQRELVELNDRVQAEVNPYAWDELMYHFRSINEGLLAIKKDLEGS